MNPIIITGATGSMGAVAVKEMALKGYPIIMACRNLQKGTSLIQKISSEVPGAHLELKELDLKSRSSVHEFVNSLKGITIDGLFNNAGMMSKHYSVTEEGIGQVMAVNYLNTALLTRLLIPQMADGCKVVNMVSLTTKISKISLDWTQEGEKEYGQIKTYGKSKLALLYFSIALAKRYPRLVVNVADPGIVDSKMITMDRWFDPLADRIFRPLINSPEKGVKPALAALSAHDSLRLYVGKHSDAISSKYILSPLVDQLWNQMTQMLSLD